MTIQLQEKKPQRGKANSPPLQREKQIGYKSNKGNTIWHQSHLN